MSNLDFYYFDPSQPIGQLSGNLPHWRQDGVRYFITFRLADSIPQAKLRQWQAEKEDWLKRNPPPHTLDQIGAFKEMFPQRFHRWLDAGYGACVLGRPDVAKLMYDVLKYFNGKRYELGEHIVMPNHVHAVVAPMPGQYGPQLRLPCCAYSVALLILTLLPFALEHSTLSFPARKRGIEKFLLDRHCEARSNLGLHDGLHSKEIASCLAMTATPRNDGACI